MTTIKYTRKISLLIIGSLLAGIAVASIFFVVYLHIKTPPSTQLNFEQMQTKISQQQLTIQDIQAEQEKMQQQLLRKNTNWKLAEIIHFVKMADTTLNTEGDIKTAINLLTNAKQLAIDVELSALNNAITNDLITLQNSHSIDTADILSRLTHLNQKITNCNPLPKTEETAISPEIKPSTQSNLQWWQKIYTNLRETIRSSFILKRRDIEPLPTPEQLVTLRLNIQTKLLQAEWAVIHKQPNLYKDSLEQTIIWISIHLASFNPETIAIIESLQELKDINIQPTVPTIHNSTRAIQEIYESNSQGIN